MKQPKQIRVWIARDNIQSIGDTVIFRTKPRKVMMGDIDEIFKDSFYYNLNNGKSSVENGLTIPKIGLSLGELKRAVITLEEKDDKR